jgi:hypothetical protein
MKNKELLISPAYDWVDKLDITPPKPAKSYIPEWYKKLDSCMHKEYKNVPFRLPNYLGGGTNMTSKMCLPVLDSMMTGYIITMPCDVQFVDNNLYNHRIVWDVGWEVITAQSAKQTEGLNHFGSDIFEENAYRFEGLWKITPPKGYSLLFTHPFWNYNTPFFTTTGIVDSDVHDAQIHVPFFIKKGFNGMIEKDTPIIQVIPIKRETWNIKQLPYTMNMHPQNIYLKLVRSYKKRFWHRKEYD